MYKHSGRICVGALGLGMGVVWGVMMLLMGFVSMHGTYGQAFFTMMASLYPGYAATVGGSFMGLLWGFVDGFISGVLIAVLYNFFCHCCNRCCKSSCVTSTCETSTCETKPDAYK